MEWFFLALASAVTSACFTLTQRRFSTGARDVDEMHTSQAFQLVIGLFFIVVAFVVGKPILLDIKPFNALILMVSYGLGSLFIFSALKRVAASVYAVLFATTAIWTALLSRLFLQDEITVFKVGAILCILFAVALVSYDKRVKRALHANSGMFFTIAAGFCFAIGTVNDAYILNGDVDVLSYMAPAFLLPGIFMLVVGGKKTLALPKMLRRADFLRNIALICAFYSVSALLFYAAIGQVGHGDVTLARVVSQSSILFVALGGVIFLKERANVVTKFAGVAFAMLGLVLASLG